jgi:hypothetical protein
MLSGEFDFVHTAFPGRRHLPVVTPGLVVVLSPLRGKWGTPPPPIATDRSPIGHPAA